MHTPDSASSRTWFITGASRGLGRAFALAALERGDQVAAAARTIVRQDFDDRYGDRLLALPLDVTDRDAVFAAVNAAVEHFGRLDIVVNNEPFSSCVAVGFDAVQDEDGLHDRGRSAWAAAQLDQDFPGLEGGDRAFAAGADLRVRSVDGLLPA